MRFDPDRPLTLRELEEGGRDELHVVPLADSLVPALLNWPAGESLVVGLHAPWGRGKTTLLNVLNDTLLRWEGGSDAPARRAIPIKFNPWNYASAPVMVAAFFETLAAHLRTARGLDARTRTALAESVDALSMAAIPLAATAVGAPSSSWFAKPLGKTLKGWVAGGEVTLEKRKKAFGRALRELGRTDLRPRVVVLIDDLDRADAAEVMTILKLVRLLVNLPNITYVLAADDERVRRLLLRAGDPDYSESFLEKIVQVAIPLPAVPDDTLETLVKRSILEVFSEAGLDGADLFAENEFDYRLHYGRVLGFRIRTLRDRARLTNALRFLLLSRGRRPEVHLEDVVLVAFLQTFYPELHGRIRKHPRLLTELSTGRYLLQRLRDDDPGEREKTAREIRERLFAGLTISAPVEDQVLRIVRALFPFALEGRSPESWEWAELRRENRIQHPDRFYRYFLVAPPEHEIPDVIVDRTVQALLTSLEHADVEEACQALVESAPAEAEAESFRGKLLDRLDPLVEDLLARAGGVGLERLVETLFTCSTLYSNEDAWEVVWHLLRAHGVREVSDVHRGRAVGVATRLTADPVAAVQKGGSYLWDPITAGALRPSGHGLVAEALLRRAEEIASDMGRLDGLTPSGLELVLLGWEHALRLAHDDTTPLRDRLESWLSSAPAALPLFLATVAADTADGPHSQFPEGRDRETLMRLARWHDLDRLHALVRRAQSSDAVPDPHNLIGQFLALPPNAGSPAAADAEDEQ